MLIFSSPKLKLIFREGETKIYEYVDALPRVYFAENIEMVASKKSEDLLRRTLALSLKGRYAVIESPISVLSVPLSADEFARIELYDINTISIMTQSTSRRLLIILNQFSQTARVKIDGNATDLMRVNYIFSGVVVPGGRHSIVLTY